jgi:hypothetical protein
MSSTFGRYRVSVPGNTHHQTNIMKKYPVLTLTVLVLAFVSLVCCGSDSDTDDPEVFYVELTDDLCREDLYADDLAIFARNGSASQETPPRFGTVNQETVDRMIANAWDGPMYMINYIHHYDEAQYSADYDGPEDTDVTGREADSRYNPFQYMEIIGARLVYASTVMDVREGPAQPWNDYSIVEYPCAFAYFAMSEHPEFASTAVHKDAGVETSVMVAAWLGESPVPPGFSAPEASAGGTPMELVEMIRFTPNGPGNLDAYTDAVRERAAVYGIYESVQLDVLGTYLDDATPDSWDAVRFRYVPNMDALARFEADPVVVEAREEHFVSAVAETWSVIVTPHTYALPGAPPLPTTSEGLLECAGDAECVDAGYESCLDLGAAAFCSTLDCASADDCSSGQTCCSCPAREELPAALQGTAACLPEAAAQNLSEICECATTPVDGGVTPNPALDVSGNLYDPTDPNCFTPVPPPSADLVLADDIPVAYTPVFEDGSCGFEDWPATFLDDCSEPLTDDAADHRGLWQAVSGNVGTLLRIEQCGDRVAITGGIAGEETNHAVHDMRMDGTFENGVNDVNVQTCRPLSVRTEFIGGTTQALYGSEADQPAVTRERVGDRIVETRFSEGVVSEYVRICRIPE